MELGRWKYKGKDKSLFDKEAKLSQIDEEFCYADFGDGKPIVMLRSTFYDEKTRENS